MFVSTLFRLPYLRLFHPPQTPATPWLISVCCMSSNENRKPSQNDYPGRPYRRVKRSEKDPFGYSFSQRFPKPKRLDSPNLTFEERFKHKAEMSLPEELPRQVFDYFLVMDFEATCDKQTQPIPQEIIEFPVVKIDARTMEPVATFHQYVLPTIHPNLTPFCTQLTGIIQDMIDNQPSLEETLRLFHRWMDKEGLLKPDVQCSFITCGDWDLGEMLPSQARHFNLALPSYFHQWVNVKHAFSESVGHYPRSLMLMLDSLGIQHTGRAHSGIDDCKNIVQIVKALAKRGHVFRTSNKTKKSNIRQIEIGTSTGTRNRE